MAAMPCTPLLCSGKHLVFTFQRGPHAVYSSQQPSHSVWLNYSFCFFICLLHSEHIDRAMYFSKGTYCICCSVAQRRSVANSDPLPTPSWCLVSQPRLIPGKPFQICERSNRVSQSSSETAKHEFSPLIRAENHNQVFISSNTFAGLTGTSHVSVHSICKDLSAVKWLRLFALHARTVGVQKHSYFMCFSLKLANTLWMRPSCPCGRSSTTPRPPGPINATGNRSSFYQLITCFRPMRPAWHLQSVLSEC